ncbi:MAG: DEAD/DEAH box helicase family protein [Bacteroidales bacterium]|nr:DEAD/DEAH box helicase family protein [Bacteroidales bacterium]
MKNFDYLNGIDELTDLYFFCNNAEETQKEHPNTCALNGRMALEWVVRAIYRLKHIEIDDRDSLYELMTGEPFTEFIDDDRLMMAAHYVRKIGNKSAHKGNVVGGQAFFSLLNIYNVVGSVLLKLGVIPSLAPFDRDLIPDTTTKPILSVNAVPQPPQTFVDEVDAAKVVKPVPVSMDFGYTEAETRKYFIDLMLNEAGWEVLDREGAIVPRKAGIEIEVEGMPNNEGKGYADYVLFGANGKPLAVVEAKRTSKDPAVGKHQAELYADCLERKYGVKPVIYYTNGYRTFVIDRLGYPSREVFGFHTEEDLEVLIQRQHRAPITDLHIDNIITDREYQKRGIRAICEHLNTQHRRGLLVMATGTGKTRVAISLTDVLMRNAWVKNVLFLADRTALVKQAHKNFVKLLPNATTCILSEDKEPDMNARIMFSTYQTMINYIDTDAKEFSVGRFDLIIIDEAHRSVFGKYTAIFSYFDTFLIGLTATPRDEVEKSTYDLFELESGEPNFAYELEEAVKDGYLVDYNTLVRTTDILKNGIKYASLTDEEKKQMEAVWKYEMMKKDLLEEEHRDIERQEIFKYIFNENTIDKVLIDLMTNGLKVNGGDMIGKTIIFAYNHKHADLIVRRFHKLYPSLGADFCVLIDNYVNYAQDLIEKFEVREKRPQIAVSVDMLDTGIDVPDILNLVFFKPVHSYIKFWQMIGRGTRLSPNIYDIGEDKTEFYIFDWCGNFEFFGNHPKGKEPLPVLSLTERLFGLRADLAYVLQKSEYQADAFAKSLHDNLKATLKGQVAELSDTHISVRQSWEVVDKFRQDASWTYLSNIDVLDLKEKVAPLIVPPAGSDAARRFDILLTHIMLSLVDDEVSAERSKVLVQKTAQHLEDMASIPQVAAKMGIIKEVADAKFWENPTLDKLEKVREEMRDLVQFLLGTDNRTFTINIQDAVEEKEGAVSVKPTLTYKQRVIDYLAKNRNLPVLRKIFNMEKLSQADIDELERICWQELGTKEEYQKYVEKGKMICGDSVAAFIRAQIGVDRVVAVNRFAEFLSGASLNTMQEEYLKTIITYVCENGDITPNTLTNDATFSDYDWYEVFGQNLILVRKYVDTFHELIAA